jgi:hypothetical protein
MLLVGAHESGGLGRVEIALSFVYTTYGEFRAVGLRMCRAAGF